MLSLDTVKTLTIYTKKEIQNLYVQFKEALTYAYETEEPEPINDALKFISFFYYLSDVPKFLPELNTIGQIQMTSLMEIMFIKCAHWKQKELFQKWIGSLTLKFQNCLQTFKAKPQILANQISEQLSIEHINFYANYMATGSRSNNNDLMGVVISFFRVFLINQLQNKKTQFKLTQQGEIISEWKKLNESAISISQVVDNVKMEEICVSVSYWLCSVKKQFIKQCIINGIINFLLRSLGNKATSEWYGRKIINFLKLLLLQVDVSQKTFSQTDLQSFLAKFTMKYDSQAIIQLVRNLFNTLEVDYPQKIQHNKDALISFWEKKEPKLLRALIEQTRILLLYAENTNARKQLEKEENDEYFLKVINSEENLQILLQIFNLLAYGYKFRKTDENNHIAGTIMAKISAILTNNKLKAQLNNDRKKLLINMIRVIKQLLQNKQKKKEVLGGIKHLNLYKKFLLFSDCTNFRYERQLYSLKRQMDKEEKNSRQTYKETVESKQEKKNQEAVVNALVKEINEGKNKKNQLEEDLEQVQLFYEIVSKGQQTVSPQTVEGIAKKIRVESNETQTVQIAILDHSEVQRNREISEKINYYAVASLTEIQQNQGTKGVDQNALKKIIKIGLTTEDANMLKTTAEYLQALQANGGVPEKYEKQVNEVFRRNKNMQGEDYEIPVNQSPKTNETNPESIHDLKNLLQKMEKRQLSEEEAELLMQNLLELSNPQEVKIILAKIQGFKELYGQNQVLYLQYLLSLAQKQEYKNMICSEKGQIIGKIFINTHNPASINIIFSILTEIIRENIVEYEAYFKNFLNFSYQYLSKQSLDFTDICLQFLEYSPPAQRHDSYMGLIYANPQFISRQAFYLVEKRKEWEKFWQIHRQSVMKNVKEEKKLTYHFFSLVCRDCKNEIWNNHKLIEIVEHMLSIFQQKNSQIFSKQPSDHLIRKLLRLATVFLATSKNEDIDIDPIIQDLYSQVTYQLSAHPMIRDPKKLKARSEEYVFILLNIILYIMRRNNGFNMVKQKINTTLTALDRVREYKKGEINDIIFQIIRVILLKDSQGKVYMQFLKYLNKYRNQLESKMSSKGAQHLLACQKIILALKEKNKQKFKNEYMEYFFSQMEVKTKSSKENLSFTDEELLKHLKNLLNPPYQYGLNELQKHLRCVQTNQFANVLVKVFLKCQPLYEEDSSHISKSLTQVQEKIAQSIWAPGCQLNEYFYGMIQMNMIGLKVCLRRKGIGLEGIRITCDKLLSSPKENVLVCTQILHLNAKNKKELEIVLEKQIPGIINETYKKKGKDPEYGRVLADFIGSSSKLKTLQAQYEIQKQLYENLGTHKSDIPVLASTFFAISGLVFTNISNQKFLGEKGKVKIYLELMKLYKQKVIIFDKGCSILCNLIYKNLPQIPILLSLQAEKIVLGIFECIPYNHEAYKRFLRFIGNLSLDLTAATSLVNSKFLIFWSNIIEAGEKNNHDDVIILAIDVIFNLVNFHEIQAKNIAYKISQTNCLEKIIYLMQKYILNTGIVKSGLDAIEKILVLDINRESALNLGILKCLQDISKTQSWNSSILQGWVRVLFSLVSTSSIEKILTSEILMAGSQFLKSHPQTDPKTLELLIVIMDKTVKGGDEKKYEKGGIIDLQVQLLKIRHLPASAAGSIIDMLEDLHKKKLLSSHSYLKIFDGLMSRLEIQFKDSNSKRIIKLLVKIRDRIIINTKAAGILLEFGYIFLTQSESMTLTKYHKRVREFVCLLSYFIAFNIELKLIFREEGFIQILQSWIRIDSSLEEDNSVGVACKICIFSIQNEQRFLVNISDKVVTDKSYYDKLAEKHKCTLYRTDGSNKSAVIRWDKENEQLIAYKTPGGQKKEKYKTPLYEVVGLRHTYEEGDSLIKVSPFGIGGIFQKNANIENCMTLIGLVGEELSIRRFDIEFPSKKEKEYFVENLKLCVSYEFKERKTVY